MCGVFAYLGHQDAVTAVIKGLKKLEYRGYDSSGVAFIENDNLIVIKEAGKISVLEGKIKEKSFSTHTAIAHTRWATHGEPCARNAHPHCDKNHTVAVVHNGVIENYLHIKQNLKDAVFKSDTDTEVVPALIANLYRRDFLKACIGAFSKLEGAFALAIIHKDHPNTLIATAEKSPLVVGYQKTTKETYIASDPSALAGLDLDLFFLKDGAISLLKKGEYPIFYDKMGVRIEVIATHPNMLSSDISKGIFPHFMLKEIFEQESSVHTVIKKYTDPLSKQPLFKELPGLKLDFSDIDHITIIACGTSYNAGLLGYITLSH
ncbi:MAG: hypothetical protein FJZ57_04480 [Chlamydiae bacterium]|nr:hypothetical protein [Chlamydiota bacterium]